MRADSSGFLCLRDRALYDYPPLWEETQGAAVALIGKM